MTTETNIITNGWEYISEINPINLPIEQKIQNLYLQEYNSSYNTFIKSLCIDTDTLSSIVDSFKDKIDTRTQLPISKYKFIVDISEDNDIINKDSEFEIKFLKSKFLNYKQKKIKSDLINYYKPLGYFVKGPFDLINDSKVNKFYIELCWHTNPTETNTYTNTY